MNIKLLRQFAILDELISAKNAELERLKSLRAQIGPLVFKEFQNNEVREQTIEPFITNPKGDKILIFQDGKPRKIEPSSEPKAHILKETEPQFFEWLRTNGHGSLIKETIHAKTLESWVKQMKEKNMVLPSLITVHYVESAKVKTGR